MTSSPPSTMESVILQLHDISAVTFPSSSSPILIDLRRVVSSPSLLRQISQTLISQTIKTSSSDLLTTALPHSAALPLATCLSTSLDVPMLVPRAASHGAFDGVFKAGQTCLVVENVVTSGSDVVEAAAALRAEGMRVVDAVAVVDGEEGGRERLAEEGIQMHAMVTVSEVVRVLKENGRVPEEAERAAVVEEKNRKVLPAVPNHGESGGFETADELLNVGDKVSALGDECNTNLLPERSNPEDGHKMEYSNHGDQSSQISQKARSTTNKPKRGGNFMIEEDILLVLAWLNISFDALLGNEPKQKAYWLRVWEYFHKHKNFISERNQISLMNRWSTIQIATNKFCACYAQIAQNSGVPDKDQLTHAKMKYREMYGSSFQFEHCWNELKDQPKWLAGSKTKPRRNRSATPYTSSPSTPDSINAGDGDASHDTISDNERPPSYKVDSQGDGCRTDLFPGSSNHEDDQNKMEYSNHGDQLSQFPQKKRSTTNRTQRGTNFTIEEDILLVAAWLNINLDAIEGNEQKHKMYWLRVWEYFHEHKNFISDRSQTSLMHRWSTIQLSTNKFCACFAQIGSRYHSDVPDKDQVLKAKAKYRELCGSSFPFQHCWNELRDHPKWLEESKKKKPKRDRFAIPHTSSPSTPDSINVEDVGHDTILEVERPPSDKVEADLSNKQKSQDQENGCSSSPLAMLLPDLKEDEQKTNEKKMDIFEKTYLQEQERLALEQQRLALEQLKEEERIMLIDTSRMPPHQAEYFRRRQMKILEK